MVKFTLVFEPREKEMIGIMFFILLDSLPWLHLIIPFARNIEEADYWEFGFYGDEGLNVRRSFKKN